MIADTQAKMATAAFGEPLGGVPGTGVAKNPLEQLFGPEKAEAILAALASAGLTIVPMEPPPIPSAVPPGAAGTGGLDYVGAIKAALQDNQVGSGVDHA